MKKKLLIALAVLFGSYQAGAQTASATIGMGIIGPACTNCGLLTGVQSDFGYGVLDNISVNAGFNYYWQTEEVVGWTGKESTVHIQAGGKWYPKEVFRGFYLSPDLGFITYTYNYNGTNLVEYKNFTFGANMGWDINIADFIIINPHFGYGTWFQDSKGRVDFGLRIGAKF